MDWKVRKDRPYGRLGGIRGLCSRAALGSGRDVGSAGRGCIGEGIIFVMVVDDVTYFKADDSYRNDFLLAGSAPFEPYPDKIKTTIRTYYEILADVLENPVEPARWAQLS
jgi:hypothetical protein